MAMRNDVQRWMDTCLRISHATHSRDVLNNILAGTLSVSLLALILSPAVGWHTLAGKTLALSSLSLLAGALAALIVNRRSHLHAGGLFVLLLSAILLGTGAGAEGLVIPVLMAGIMLWPWASLAAAGLCSLAATALSACRTGYASGMSLPLTLFAAALVAWLATHNLQRMRQTHRQSERQRAETERHLGQIETRLRQAQKMEAMGRLAAGVAHDFNNYLTVIDSYVDLLRMDLAPQAPTRRELDEIARVVSLSKTLTRQLLAFSRQKAGAACHPQVLDINALLAKAHGILQRLAGPNIELVLRCDPNLPPVRAGPGQIEQVLLNLVGNARDAIAGPGTITIHTAHLDGHQQECPPSMPAPVVMISVSDTGAGIDDHTLPHIFEPFYTTKEDGCGTGLGLSIVYSIVRQSGGHIEVQSAVGRGTTFQIYLPGVQGEQEQR